MADAVVAERRLMHAVFEANSDVHEFDDLCEGMLLL